MRYINDFEGSVDLSEIQIQVSPKIIAVGKDSENDKALVVDSLDALTDEEQDKLTKFIQGKKSAPKSDYAAAQTIEEKLQIIAKKVGLL